MQNILKHYCSVKYYEVCKKRYFQFVSNQTKEISKLMIKTHNKY